MRWEQCSRQKQQAARRPWEGLPGSFEDQPEPVWLSGHLTEELGGAQALVHEAALNLCWGRSGQHSAQRWLGGQVQDRGSVLLAFHF